MSDPVLRELTASEPLTLEEEYDMQRKWQSDEDKLTFIVLHRDELPSEETQEDTRTLTADERDESRMIGDVNLFFKGSTTDEDFEVEAEVMIAESAYRRRGYASEAMQLLFRFAASFRAQSALPINAEKLVVRIGESNDASRRMFEKLGFVVTKHVKVFEELEMRLQSNEGEDISKSWTAGRIARYL